jgi:hypothetical protein
MIGIDRKIGAAPWAKASLKFFPNSIIFFLLLFVFSCSHVPPKFTVESLPNYEALFQRTQGWTGGDGVFSVRLDPEEILWLFGDTFIGQVKDGHHINFNLVNNTIAIQRGIEPDLSKINFYYGEKNPDQPAAFIQPSDGVGWFWPYHGVRTKDGLFLFLIQVELTDGPPAFNFKTVAAWLGTVSNPDDPPDRWRVSQKKIPFTGEDRLFGSAVLIKGENCYIYGTVDKPLGAIREKQLILAKVPVARIVDFGQWRFFADGNWVAEIEKASPLIRNGANEFSISFQPSLNQYIMVYTQDSLSENIVFRLAPELQGPWGEPFQFYRCPEMEWDLRIFCYAAKGHPEISLSPQEIIVTYTTNSSDMALIESNARYYRPRFLKLRFQKQ